MHVEYWTRHGVEPNGDVVGPDKTVIGQVETQAGIRRSPERAGCGRPGCPCGDDGHYLSLHFGYNPYWKTVSGLFLFFGNRQEMEQFLINSFFNEIDLCVKPN